MIRPFTLICMASAFGAGLYLYQSKHTAQMLDREIGRTIKQTESIRAQTGMLKAEWALRNEPDRLAEQARAHLSLQTLKPTQFAALGELASRLPGPVAPHPERLPVEAEPAEPAAPVAAPVAANPVAPPPVAATPQVAVAAVVVPKPKPEAKPEVKIAEAKPARPVEKSAVEKPTVERVSVEKAQVERASARPEPVRVAEPVHAHAFAPPPVVASSEATAPGTVGAAVLRAMRAQEHVVSPAPVTAAPLRVAAAPAYAQPAYAQPAYAQPSVLGGQPALPPPVPFAAR